MKMTVFIFIVVFGVIGGIINDEFTTARSAGDVDSTLSEPGGDLRRVITDETNHSITDGKLLLINGGGLGKFYYKDSIQRIPGAVVKYDLVGVSHATNMGSFALCDIQAPGIQSGLNTINGSGGATGIYCGSSTTFPRLAMYLAINRTWIFIHVLRNNGQFVFIKKDSTWNNAWKLRWVDELSNAAYLSFFCGGATGTRTLSFDNVLLTSSNLYNVIPNSSDAFNRADGDLDTTDGLGHAEANGGSGDTWTSTKGTWAVRSDKASCTDTTGGGQQGIAIISSSGNTFIECSITRIAGVAGIVGRHRNDSNYLRLYHDGTNCKLDKIINNVVTNLQSTVIAYTATSVIKLFLDTNEYIASYNNINAGVGTISDTSLMNGSKVGLYTTDTVNKFDNFVSWNTREYTDLDSIPASSSSTRRRNWGWLGLGLWVVP
jgi:hypothetical protein